MKHEEHQTITVNFAYSKKEAEVALELLIKCSVEFLDIYQDSRFGPAAFWEKTAGDNGQARFSNLLKLTGYDNDPAGFFTEILTAIARDTGHGIVIRDLPLPHAFLVAILEQVLPGHGYVSIKNTEQLESVTNLNIPETDRKDLQKVIEMYPVRLSRHTIRQMMVSRDVAYQYMPFIEELDTTGFTNTWIGQFHDGLLEQMYQNRVIFLLNMSCPVYCRFCFRKHKDSRNEKNPTPADIQKAVSHVRNSPSVKEIVITGGDPFMSRANMAAAIDGLMAVDHVQTLRLATRSIAYYPNLFLENECAYLKYIKQKNLELQQKGKRMEVASHFIHPDEVSPESLDIITDLVKSGIAVYIQTPFLNNCNDTGPELVKLFSMLRGAGAELHYIYIPCSPIHGNSVYWKPLSHGIDMAAYLRAHLSDRVIPHICTATPIGKLDWFSSGWAVEKVRDKDSFLWLRTPYTPEYFKTFAPLSDKLDHIRVNDEGTIDIQYMARIGDDRYLIGNRPARKSNRNQPAGKEQIQALRNELIHTRQTAQSIVGTRLDHLCRVHETRVEIDLDAGQKDLDYIRADQRITDVVISSETDAVDALSTVEKLVRWIQKIPHVNAVRLRSMKFATDPGSFSPSVINSLGDMNRLSIARPLRLEIETWLIREQDLTTAHKTIARRLNNKGITIYCNVPLLGGVNDSDTAIHDLAYKIRETGVEFHHLYVAGLPVQNNWNPDHPVDAYDVTSIATMVRREGSGREIPNYIIATVLGEVDYGLTSSFLHDKDGLKVRLNCYSRSWFEKMDPKVSFDDTVAFDGDVPVVPVQGLVKTNDFPVS